VNVVRRCELQNRRHVFSPEPALLHDVQVASPQCRIELPMALHMEAKVVGPTTEQVEFNFVSLGHDALPEMLTDVT